jgi:hypothetical protein
MKYACIAEALTFRRARQFDDSIAVEKRPVVNIYEYGVRVSNNAFSGCWRCSGGIIERAWFKSFTMAGGIFVGFAIFRGL